MRNKLQHLLKITNGSYGRIRVLRTVALVCFVGLWFTKVGVASSGDIEIHLNGGQDVLHIGQVNTIEIWIKNDAVLQGMTVAFEFSSPLNFLIDSAFGSHGFVNEEGDAIGVWTFGDLFVVSSVDGISPDSIFFGGVAESAGLPINNSIHAMVYSMRVEVLSGQQPTADGFCVDNIFFPPAGEWVFVDSSGPYIPTFHGDVNAAGADPSAAAACFNICDGSDCGTCCVGSTGNADGDQDDLVDVRDLVALINALFITFEPLDCPEEANADGDVEGLIDVRDLVALINALFITFEPLPACP